jgi:hypothetical protein
VNRHPNRAKYPAVILVRVRGRVYVAERCRPEVHVRDTPVEYEAQNAPLPLGDAVAMWRRLTGRDR